ncbi:MAG: hypothetical protein EU548_08000, partial [Promethearchaeota archaeon]
MSVKKYESRFEAGEILADLIDEEDHELHETIMNTPEDFLCFAIPNGGVPVAEGFCSKLDLRYDFVIVRKIKIPHNTEAGFGSITTDGTVLINEPLLKRLSLTEQQVKDSIGITKNEIQERLEYYDKSQELDSQYAKIVPGKTIFMIDDGLASGFTMLAAIKMVKKYQPREIYIAVPTAPHRTVERVKKKVKRIFC